LIPEGVRFYKAGDLCSQGSSREKQPFEFEKKTYLPPSNSHWKANYPEGMNRLATLGRIHVAKNSIRYRRFSNDFPFQEVGNIWTDTLTGSFTDEKQYVVQTNLKVIERCLLMITNPGDLVLDITCGSGTTAYVAEQWGRRWITCDVSRVPLALARQRLLTATFPYYELKDESRGPAGGFVYKRKQNKKGEEVGGIVPHITLESIANDEPPDEEVLVDRPEEISAYTRVAGPFTLEATIPVTLDPDGAEAEEVAPEQEATMDFHDRLLAVLQKSPVIHLEGNRTVTFQQVRRPAKTLNLSAEAMIKASDQDGATLTDVVNEVIEQNAGMLPLSQKLVAIVFGSENGAISEQLVYGSAQEAAAKHYTHLYVIGFAIHPNARQLVEHCDEMLGIPATYIQATPDLLMGDLLKNMRSSQIFSVCGLPDITIHAVKEGRYQVELLGLDVFDPATMENDHRKGNDVPAWFLDTDYNGLCFHVCQAFFPRTSAWDSIKKALKGSYDDAVWDHLSGTTSAPFEPGEHQKIAVKVIDDRGNELLVVREIKA